MQYQFFFKEWMLVVHIFDPKEFKIILCQRQIKKTNSENLLAVLLQIKTVALCQKMNRNGQK